MDLLQLIKKKKEKKDYFLALLFKPSKIGAILFEEIEGKLLILSTKEEKINVNINELSEEELIDTCDLVISFVENSLPENEFVTKTVFGLPYDWSADSKIKKENLVKLKKLCEELELTPIGFIISAEAAIHFLQKKEGAPISGIFVEILSGIIAVYLVRAGNITEVKSGSTAEGGYAHTVENILKQMETTDVLPSKIILLDYEGINNIQQEFLSYHWMTNLPFLHLPQVTIFESGFENEAVINGVATQMGFEILDDTIDYIEKNPEKEEKNTESYENFGFLQDEDIAEKTGKEKVKKEDDDFTQKKKHVSDADFYEDNHENKHDFPNKPFSLIEKFGIFSILEKIKLARLPKAPLNLKAIFALFVLVALTVSFIFVYYNLILKADITLSLEKKTFSKDLNVALSASSKSSAKDGIVKINSIEDREEGEKKIQTTGKKETGDNATGEVIVYNKTDKQVNLTKGTILIGTNALEFELANDINIASTGAFSTTLSSTKAQIKARSYGTEYNLPSGTNFSFKDYPTSSYFAKNDNPFSGGTKKEVQVVSQSNLDNLAKMVSDELKDKATDSMKSKVSGDSLLLPIIISSDFVEKKFDRKDGEEGQTVRLYAKMKFTSGSYDKNELDNIEKELIGSSMPGSFHKDLGDSRSEIKDIKIDKNGVITGVLSINSIYIPTFDLAQLKIDIKGKNKSFYENKIRETKGVSSFNVISKNRIPILPDLLPFNLKNITITVHAD